MKKKSIILKAIPLAGLLIFVLCSSSMSQSIQLADSLLQKGIDYRRGGNMRQAEFYFREAYKIFKQHKDTSAWLEAGHEYANVLVYRSKNEQAMSLYKMLVHLKHPANDAYSRANLYNSMGLASRRIGKLNKALNYYKRSLGLAAKAKNGFLTGIIYDNMGRVYSAKGDISRSLTYRKKALPYFEGSGKQKNKARTLNNIGHTYQELSLFDKALNYYSQSLELRKKLGDNRMLATIYDNIAGIQRERGNYDQALIGFKKSLDYCEKAGTPAAKARILNNIGLLYKQLGEIDKARNYYMQSLALHEKVSGPVDVSTIDNNLGNLLFEQGDYTDAAPYFTKALLLRKKIGNSYDIASCLSRMIQLDLSKGELQQAKSYTNSLGSIAHQTGSYRLLRDWASRTGDINAQVNKLRPANSSYKKAYNYSKHLPAKDQLSAIIKLSKSYNHLGSDSSVVYGERAVQIIEHIRSNSGAVSGLKMSFFKMYSDFYIRLASWQLKYNQNKKRAFRLIELAKARSLSDDLVKASQNIEQKLPEEERIKKAQKKKKLNDLYAQMEKASDDKLLAKLKRQIRNGELSYAAYENSLHNKYDFYKKLSTPPPVSLAKAQSLNAGDTGILDYAIADNHIIIFFITGETVKVVQKTLSNADFSNSLTGWVANYKDAILANSSIKTLDNASSTLYQVLIAPFEKDLNTVSKLIIVPDGPLAYLPFEALRHHNQYLIEKFEIKYEPSLTILELLKTYGSTHRKQLFAVAASQARTNNSPGQNAFTSLPATDIEVDSIATQFKDATILKDGEASERSLKKMLQKNRYRYVHLAAHGIIDENKPARSGLALSVEGKQKASDKDDGILRAEEIYGLRLSSDMVVLSSCNTGMGKIVKGEGMLGMQQSFFYAGTSTVVVSLWSVFDRSTAYFMKVFYKNIAKNNENTDSYVDSFLHWVGWSHTIPFGNKAKAMRETKLKMIHHPLFSNPIYWAPFILVGR